MSWRALTDADLQELFYASDLLSTMTGNSDDPNDLHAALKNASPADIDEIARDAIAYAVAIDDGAYSTAEEMGDLPGCMERWAAELRCAADELRRSGPRRNRRRVHRT